MKRGLHMSVILDVKNLSKTYSIDSKVSQLVLNNISLTVNSGDFIAIMGSSGSGKSTLLYNISGMDQPTKGEIYLDDIRLTGLNEKELSDIRLAKLGFVFQQPHLIKSLSVRENIILAASLLHGGVSKELQLKAEGLMRQTGIYNLAERDVSLLSGGEAQRVGICRALMNDPRILFADEPTGALNSKMSEEIMDILVAINQSGSTIVMVTHDSKITAKANKVWFLSDGVICNEKDLGQWDKKTATLVERQKEVLRILPQFQI